MRTIKPKPFALLDTPSESVRVKIAKRAVGILAGVLVAKAAQKGIIVDEVTATGIIMGVYAVIHKGLDKVF